MTDHHKHGAVVLVSGGQDSTTCLAWAIDRWGADCIYPVSFFYEQKHEVELLCAEHILDELGVRQTQVINIPFLKELPTALTRQGMEPEAKASEMSPNEFASDHNLPSTFIPGRNLIFLAHAAAYGAVNGIYDVVTGVCEADASGYPDCRASFIHRATQALSEALDDTVRIHAPLLHITKAGTWQMADDFGILELVRQYTHTCYNGVHDENHFHEWGYGCGSCPACTERRLGYEEYARVVAS